MSTMATAADPLTGAQSRTPGYPVAAIDNTLRTLQLLNVAGEVRVVDVAVYLSVARSTAHRILSMLTYHGFAEQDGARRYHACGRSSGPQLPAGPLLSCDVRAAVARGADTIGHTLHVAVLEGNGARFVHGAVPAGASHLDLRIGLLYPALLTAAGRTLLAELSELELRALFPSRISGRGVPAIDHREVALMLDRVRRHGYAVNEAENEAGVNAVGVGIRDTSGTLVGALVAAASAGRMPRSRFASAACALTAVAHELTARL